MRQNLDRIMWPLLIVACGLICAGARAAEQTIELEDAGDAPRRELRYKYQAGDEQTMVILMDMTMASEFNGQQSPSMPIPTQRMEMEMQVRRVTEDDNLECHFEVTDIDLVEDTDQPSPMRAQMLDMLKTMIGLGGTYTQTRRGEVTNITMEYPEGMNQMVRQSMGNMEQVMGQSAVPMPEQPVGVGAKWTVTQPMDTPVFTFEQKATYTVTKLTDSDVTLDIALEQFAPEQDMTVQGQTMRLAEYTGRGEGETTIDFTSVVPRVQTAMETSTTIVPGGQPAAMKTNIKMDIKIAPKEDADAEE